VENAFNIPGVFQGAVGTVLWFHGAGSFHGLSYMSDYIPGMYRQNLTVGVEIVVSYLIFRNKCDAIQPLPTWQLRRVGLT